MVITEEGPTNKNTEYRAESRKVSGLAQSEQPELGNIVFGHSRGEFHVSRKWEEKFYDLVDAINPDTDGYVENYENSTFRISRYWWGDCTCGMGEDVEVSAHLSTCELVKPNFHYKPTNYQIQWYKYPLRDSWSNYHITIDKFEKMIDDCIESMENDGQE